MDRVIFRILLKIILVGDRTLTEVSRVEVIFLVLSCTTSSSGLGGMVKVL